jgi:hypothetical protein
VGDLHLGSHVAARRRRVKSAAARGKRATPDKLWRHFLDATGTIHTTPDAPTIDLNLRTYHPVLIQAGLADTPTPIPWLNGRELRFRFSPR